MEFPKDRLSVGTTRGKLLGTYQKHHVHGFPKNANIFEKTVRRKEKNGMGRYKPLCWQGKEVIHGKVYNWHGHKVCRKHYKWCCEHLRGIPPRPPQSPYMPNHKSGFNWAWVIAGALGLLLLFKMSGGF